MSGHTPGPWTWTRNPTDGCCWDHHVETVERGTGPMASYAIGSVADVSGEANARLIAAAPDLLAACEAAIKEDCGLACADQIRAAIAKAGSP